ncbi:hypothetical protein NBM05_08315 [Rothia sp. AR01]|uniref:Uncharacterized protein n=1 Tax=Rothia santali TaxID=2949643 RepID=A0A9X2HEX6_9MICC|nr:hypothetical protein [Rothia santali]MCP3426004.1 hypothetical protein [Rothia santali]
MTPTLPALLEELRASHTIRARQDLLEQKTHDVDRAKDRLAEAQDAVRRALAERKTARADLEAACATHPGARPWHDIETEILRGHADP